MVYLAKMVQPPEQENTKKKEHIVVPELIKNFTNDLNSILSPLSPPSNIMLIFIGSIYAFVGLENSFFKYNGVN